MAWDDAKKAKAVELYTKAEPTPENSIEIVKEIAEALGETPNGVRMILSKAEVYVKQAASKGASTSSGASDKPKRVSKADSIAALQAIIEGEGLEADAEILDKLTGKQAVYFTELLQKFL